jgi:transposase
MCGMPDGLPICCSTACSKEASFLLSRYRSNLVEERARAVNSLRKTLEDTTIKLGDVATGILGRSARAMLNGLLAGQTDPQVLADLAHGRLWARWVALKEALVVILTAHHRFLLSEQLIHHDPLEEAIRRVSQEIEARMRLPDPPQQILPTGNELTG